MTRFRRDGTVPSIVDKEVIEAVKEGTVEVVGAVESLDSAGVILAGGSRVEPDAIICATGYRRALEPLVGHLGVLDDRGWPAVAAPKARGARPALRWLHKPPGRARLHVQAGEAVRQGDRPRGQVPPLRGCRKSCVSRAKQAPRRDATTCLFMKHEELSSGGATGYRHFRINERQRRLVGCQ